MDTAAVTDGLYPVALALANIGLGVALYVTGALFFALLLWLSGALVLVAMISGVHRTLSRSPVTD